MKGTNDKGKNLELQIIQYAPNLDLDDVLEAIAFCRGNVSAVCDMTGINYGRLMRMRKKYLEIDQAFYLAKQRIVDKAKDNLTEALENKEPWATIFALKTLGKHEGFTEKIEIDANNNPQTVIRFVWDSDGDDNSGHTPIGSELLE